MHAQTLRGQVNRLIVFRGVKKFMETHLVCPSSIELAREIPLAEAAIGRHMHALANADGLPFPLSIGHARQAETVLASRRFHMAEEKIIEVDLAIANPDFGSIQETEEDGN